jgi:hypothetical protein
MTPYYRAAFSAFGGYANYLGPIKGEKSMAKATLTIVTSGIGLVFRDKTAWKMIMPFDEKDNPEKGHSVRLKLAESDPGIALKGEFRKVIITATNNNGGAIGKPETGDDFSRFFNINGSKAHENGVALIKDWDKYAVLFTIKGAKIHLDKPTQSRFTLVNKKTHADVKPLGEIGFSAAIKIRADNIKIDVPGWPVAGVFPKEFHRDDTIFIDNDCHECPNRNNSDFEMLYDHVMRDAVDKDLMFQIELDPKVKKDASPADLADKHNPPPNRAGLPCNVVYASEPFVIE